MHNILVVSELRSYMTMAIEENLKNADYRVYNEGTDITAISELDVDISAILLYVDADLLKKQKAMVYIKDKALEDDIPVFAIGDSNEIEGFMSVFP